MPDLSTALAALQRAADDHRAIKAQAMDPEGPPAPAVQAMGFGERLFMCFSQYLNAIYFGGDPDETLSARSHREGRTVWAARIDWVFGKDHCRITHERTVKRQYRRAWGG